MSRALAGSLIVAIGMATVLGGCSDMSGGFGGWPAKTTEAGAPASEASQAGTRFRYPDEAPVLDAKGLRTFVIGYKPRVVVLDFWALWCRQSREEMPALAALQEEAGLNGPQVISCNLDGPDVWRSQTVPRLQSLGANFPCVVLSAEAKKDLREWLAPNWSYDLPARFIIDAHGRVAHRAIGEGALAQACDEAKRLAGEGARKQGPERLALGAAALRITLIEVGKGQARPMPEIVAASANSQQLADAATQQITGEIDRKGNPRIAVLPFASLRNRSRAGQFGRDAADRLTRALRDKGYYDLIGPTQAEQMLADLNLTMMGIDFDPSMVRDRVKCDFLVLGWMRDNPVEPPAGAGAAAAAADSDGDSAIDLRPGLDTP